MPFPFMCPFSAASFKMSSMSCASPDVASVTVVVVSCVTMSPFTTFFWTVVVVVVFLTAETLPGSFLTEVVDCVALVTGAFFAAVDNGFLTPTALSEDAFGAAAGGDFNWK